MDTTEETAWEKNNNNGTNESRFPESYCWRNIVSMTRSAMSARPKVTETLNCSDSLN